MKILFLALLVLLIPGVAFAAPDSAVCQVLASHQPRADVIHQPDADVNANPNTTVVPEIVKVPLTIDLAKRVAALEGEEVELDAPMGMVEIHQNGKVFYDGQDWTSSVMTLCGQSHVVKSEMAVTLDEPQLATEIGSEEEALAPAPPPEPEAPPAPEPVSEAVSEPELILNRTSILNNEPIINNTSLGTKRDPVSLKVDTGPVPTLPKISRPVVSTPPPELAMEPAPAPVVETAPAPVIEPQPPAVVEQVSRPVLEPAPPPVMEPQPALLPPMEPLPPPVVEVLPEPPAPNTPLVLDKTPERVTAGVPPANIIYKEVNPITGESEIIEGGDYREIYYNE